MKLDTNHSHIDETFRSYFIDTRVLFLFMITIAAVQSHIYELIKAQITPEIGP